MKVFLGKTILDTARAKLPAVFMPYIHLNTLSERNLTTLYYSLVHAHLLYGIQLWGNAYHKYIGKLEIAQRKAIRAVGNARYNEASSPLFKRLNILKLKDLYDLYIC